jgi:hypothetical protein
MRVGDSVWHAKRENIANATKATYETPNEIRTRLNYFTVMCASGYIQVMKYGEDIDNTWTVVANAREFGGKIKEGDLFWVDGEKPNEAIERKYGNGASANAVVKSVRLGNRSIEITLTRNKNRQKR